MSPRSLLEKNEFPDLNKEYRPKFDTGFKEIYNVKSQEGTNEFTLTFDDGPHEILTAKLLNILAKNKVKATFFILTNRINARTIPLIERMYREGHLVGVHGFDHTDVNRLDVKQFHQNVKAAILKLYAIQKNIGIFQKEIYFRFPYGDYGLNSKYHHIEELKKISNELFSENCINFVFWNIDTADWVPSMTPEQITQSIIAHFEGGKAFTYKKMARNHWMPEAIEIVNPPRGGVDLMHDIHPQSVAAVPMILEALEKRSIKIVPLNKVKEYSFKGKKCELRKEFRNL